MKNKNPDSRSILNEREKWEKTGYRKQTIKIVDENTKKKLYRRPVTATIFGVLQAFIVEWRKRNGTKKRRNLMAGRSRVIMRFHRLTSLFYSRNAILCYSFFWPLVRPVRRQRTKTLFQLALSSSTGSKVGRLISWILEPFACYILHQKECCFSSRNWW